MSMIFFAIYEILGIEHRIIPNYTKSGGNGIYI